LNLHAQAVEIILRNELFERDTENSVFMILMMWVRENYKDRQLYLPALLPLVDFTEMSHYFLISVVPSVFQEITNENVKKSLSYHYTLALENKIKMAKDVSFVPPTPVIRRLNAYESSDQKFAMKVEFRKISEWKIGEKYYSQPIFSNGYYFYFFMRVEISTADQSQYLAGYLRCTSEVTSNPLHYLPVNVTFEIELTDGRKRKFPPVSVVFDHFDRSIGSRMNPPNDNWERIRNGNSDIVKEDKIIVIISVEFKK